MLIIVIMLIFAILTFEYIKKEFYVEDIIDSIIYGLFTLILTITVGFVLIVMTHVVAINFYENTRFINLENELVSTAYIYSVDIGGGIYTYYTTEDNRYLKYDTLDSDKLRIVVDSNKKSKIVTYNEVLKFSGALKYIFVDRIILDNYGVIYLTDKSYIDN